MILALGNAKHVQLYKDDPHRHSGKVEASAFELTLVRGPLTLSKTTGRARWRGATSGIKKSPSRFHMMSANFCTEGMLNVSPSGAMPVGSVQERLPA